MKVGMTLENRYKLVKEIGQGGTSVVYLAKDLQLGKYWAVKCVSLDRNKNFDNAIKKEVELLSGLDHPDIPRIVQVITTDTHLYVVMDYINGMSLFDKMKTEGIQDEEDVILWSRNLCNILEYLHSAKEHPIIYRDLKPLNVMLVNNRPKLIDFGIAVMCDPEKPTAKQSIGTKGYAPPEQYRNGSNILLPASDIYSLGATMYKLLTNRTLESHTKPYTNIRKYNPRVTEGMEQIVYKCIQNDPKDRYQSALELKNDLEKLRTICHEPRERVLRQLALTGISLFLTLVFTTVTVFGYQSIQSEKTTYYQQHYTAAIEFEQSGNQKQAEDEYLLAIQNQPQNGEVYQRLYTLMKPQINDNDYDQKMKDLIDYFKSNFNVQNVVLQPECAIQVLSDTMALNDSNYVNYTKELISAIKKTKAYHSKAIDPTEIEALEMVVDNNPDANIDKMVKSMDGYQQKIDQNVDLTPTQKINQYYAILLFYNAYSAQIDDITNRLKTLGDRCESIIASQEGNASFTFDKTIQLYQMMALTNQNLALNSQSDDDKKQLYETSKYWYEKLDNLKMPEAETFLLKKGTAYQQLADCNLKLGDIPGARNALASAKNIYARALAKNQGNINTYIYLIQTCVSEQGLNSADSRNYDEVKNYYQALNACRQDNLTTTQLAQIKAIKTQLESLGIG